MFRYGVIFCRNEIIAEFPQSVEMHDLTLRILSKMDRSCSTSVVEQGMYLFMSYNNEGLASFACICDKTVATFQCKDFLDKLKSSWISKYGIEIDDIDEIQNSASDFSCEIDSIIQFENTKESKPVRDIIPSYDSNSTESALQANMSTAFLVDEEESLTKLRCRLCIQKTGKWLLVIVFFVFVIYLIVAFFCHGYKFEGC